MEKKKSINYENFSFEENLLKLEQIVSMMEKQDVSLDEAIKLYEEGLNLSIYLNNILSKYEGIIKILDKNFEEGKYSEKDLEEELKKEIELEQLKDEEEERLENQNTIKSRKNDNGKVSNKKSMKIKSDKEDEENKIKEDYLGDEKKKIKEDSLENEKNGSLIDKDIEKEKGEQLFS